jgi:Holliday junction resolvase RusA-like endonuclease
MRHPDDGMNEPDALVPPARVCFRIPGQPVAKGRARSAPLMRGGKPVFNGAGRPVVIHHTPEKTASYESRVALAAQQAMGMRTPFGGAMHLVAEIALAIPASWSRRRQAMAEAGLICATNKPDADNVLKAIKDGLNGIVWVDDSQVVEVRVSKKYGTSPGVYVEAMELPLEKA